MLRSGLFWLAIAIAFDIWAWWPSMRRKPKSTKLPLREVPDSSLPKKVTYRMLGYPQNVHPSEDKAVQLLWDHLNNQQKREILKNGSFSVKSGPYTFHFYINNPNTYYSGRTGLMHSICIQCYGVPRGDQLLTLKLMAEADPKQFLRIAH